MDSADKATNKAMSAAMKYAMLQGYQIPTVGDNDADGTTHEVKGEHRRDAERRAAGGGARGDEGAGHRRSSLLQLDQGREAGRRPRHRLSPRCRTSSPRSARRTAKHRELRPTMRRAGRRREPDHADRPSRAGHPGVARMAPGGIGGSDMPVLFGVSRFKTKRTSCGWRSRVSGAATTARTATSRRRATSARSSCAPTPRRSSTSRSP
jgi:hypothetical protein